MMKNVPLFSKGRRMVFAGLFKPVLAGLVVVFVATALPAGEPGLKAGAGVPGELLIKAVGDMVPGTNFPDASRLPSGGASSLFEKVQPLLGGADLLFGNFESTFTDYPKTRKNTNRKMVFAFRSPPSYAHDFARAGFDILNIANNHSNDFYQAGFVDTAKAIQAAGMAQTGIKGEITYMERNGIKTAFIGFSYLSFHNSVLQLEESAALVREAAKNADVVILSVHAGAEGNTALRVANQNEKFYSENRGNMVAFSHKMIDNGADMVIGHGPHVPRAMEVYKGRLIAYSLGNFMGYKVFSIRQYTGYSLVLSARLGAKGEFLGGKIDPVQLTRAGVPYPDEEGASIGLIRELSQKDFPGSPLGISASGDLSVR